MWLGFPVLLLVLSAGSTHSTLLTPQVETNYLRDLYHSTEGHKWVFLDSSYGAVWNFSKAESGEYMSDPCADAWQGVSCAKNVSSPDAACHIKELSLEYMNLQGTIPPNVSNLIGLQTLELSSNLISGSLPADLYSLTSLQMLSINSNFLEGSLPPEISQLRQLSHLSLFLNHLSGSIPEEISALTLLSFLSVAFNSLTHTIPSALSQLTALFGLRLNHNAFTGSVPTSICRIGNLRQLTLNSNDLAGSLPTSLVELTKLAYLAFSDNFLSGTLSDGLADLTDLVLFWAHFNSFTGTIPSSLESLVNLEISIFSYNLLSGPFPTSLTRLQSLFYITVDANVLTGSLPEGLFQMTNLNVLWVNDNSFTGTISGHVGNLSNLISIDLSDNSFSKKIPASLGTIPHLVFLGLQANDLTGTVPHLQNYELEILFLQGNQLSGSMKDVIWNNPGDSTLEHLDLSSNLFSGEIPTELFQLPRIISIAMSVNCFSGRLPTDMCTATTLEVLSMEGLGAADKCHNNYPSLFSSKVILYNTMQGSLPECVWVLPGLQTLHLAGNGLSGAIPEKISSSLVDISLSYNYLSGSIPDTLQRKTSLEVLDLAYNRIRGEYKHANVTQPEARISLEVNRLSGPLSSEHLTGSEHLNILRGNRFECGDLPHNDEDFQLYHCGSQNYNTALYAWMSLLLLVLLTALFLLGIKQGYRSLWPCVRSGKLGSAELASETPGDTETDAETESKKAAEDIETEKDTLSFGSFSYDFYQPTVCKKVSSLLYNHELYVSFMFQLPLETSHEELTHIQDFCADVRALSTRLVWSACAGVVLTAPLLILKMLDEGRTDGSYMTHTHTYAWLYTLAYISGEVPVVLLMAAWVVLILILVWILYLLEVNFIKNQLKFVIPSSSPPSPATASRPSALDRMSSMDSSHRSRVYSVSSHMKGVHLLDGQGWKMLGPLLLNAIIVFTLNTVYINRLSNGTDATKLLVIQILFAGFRVMYSIVIVPILCKPIADMKKAIWMRIRIYMFNSIWVPVLATVRTSPACFEGLWTPRAQLASQYSFSECALMNFVDGEYVCIAYTEFTAAVEPLTPPFLYNYQCSSTMLTSYIPIFMYMYMFHLALPFAMFLVSCVPFQSFPRRFFRIKLPGVWWPQHWLKNNETLLTFEDEALLEQDEKGVATPRKMLNCKTVVTQFIHHICVLLTFGLCSPQLALAVSCAILVTSDLLQLMIGRFVHYRLNSLLEERPVQSGDGVRGGLRMRLSLAKIDHALCALSEQLSETIILVKSCFVPILTTSTCFLCFICFDMAGDGQRGWRKSVWVLIAFACLYVALLLGRRTLRKNIYRSTKEKNPFLFDKNRDNDDNDYVNKSGSGDGECRSVDNFELESGTVV